VSTKTNFAKTKLKEFLNRIENLVKEKDF
jgi:uncharacterized protein (UPF0335 family)